MARLGHVSLGVILVTVIGAAVLGDSAGYQIGRRYGPRLLQLGMLKRHRRRLDDAADLLAGRGGVAVFFGRWAAFLRAVMPALAGTARLPYARLLAFNAAGGLAWGTAVVLVGYGAGASYATAEKMLGRGSAVAVIALVLVALLVQRLRRRRLRLAR